MVSRFKGLNIPEVNGYEAVAFTRNGYYDYAGIKPLVQRRLTTI